MRIQDIRIGAEAGFERWGRFVVRYPVRILVLVLIFSGTFISQAPRLVFDTAIEGFLLDDDPILIAYNDFRDRFERDDAAILAIRPPEIFELAFLEKLKAFHEELEDEVLYLNQVDSLINARSTRGAEGELIVEDLFEDWPEDDAQLAIIRDRALANPIYQNLLLSQDGVYTTVAVKFDTYSDDGDELDLSGFDDSDEPGGEDEGDAAEEKPYLTGEETLDAIASVRQVMERYQGPDFEIYLAGAPVITERLTDSMSSDMRKFLGLSIVAAGIFLFVLFRRVSATLIPIGVVLLSLGTTIGFMPLLDIPLQVPTQILPAFLLAVGIGDSVHLLAIFYQQLEVKDSKEEAIVASLAHSGFPVLMTSLTTAGALASFVSATLAPIHNLGILAPIGVLIALVYTMTLLPALLALVPASTRLRGGQRLGLIDDFLTACANLSTTRPWTVVIVSALLLIVGIVGASQLRFSQNPVEWFPESDDLRIAIDLWSEEFRGAVTIEVLFDTGEENALQDPEFLAILDELQASNESLAFGEISIGKSLSIVDILKEIHQALNQGDPAYRVIPGNRQLIAQELLLFENSGSEDLEDFTDSLFSTGRMTLRAPWRDAITYAPMVRHVESSYREAVGEDVKVTVTGILPLLARTFEAVIHSMARSYVIAFLVITPLMMFLLASVRLGLLSMIPNLMPIILTLGMMGYFDIPLDMFTLLIGSIALGLAVDDTIHFMNGFRRYYEETGDPALAVHRTLETSGQAMLITTLVLCAGFFIFTLGYMYSIFYFGLLTGTALALAFVGDVTLAPALMFLVTRGRQRKAAGAGAPEN